mgnify:CR=1 FL=1
MKLFISGWIKREFDAGCRHMPGGVACTADGAAVIDRAGKRADLATGFAIGGALLAGASPAVFFTAPAEAVQVTPIATSHELKRLVPETQLVRCPGAGHIEWWNLDSQAYESKMISFLDDATS